MQCTRCGADVEAQFRFCPQCGQRVGDGRDGKPLAGERKLVSVLFCDLIDSTAIAERLDPEEFGDLLDQYIHRAFAEVYRFDGYVNQLAGDGFMALFGAPIAHEDAPERAVRAALAVQRAIGDLAARRTPVRARIGIHTGPVVVGTVGTDRRMDYTAIGDTTNLAARLESMAQPGAILMSEATHRLVRGRFRVRETGPLAVKGKTEPVTAFEVLGEAGESGIIELAATRGLTPFVGRQRELGELEASFARAAARERHVVSVVGDAGSGKSRLVYEFRRRFDSEPVAVLEGRCASLNQTTPFYPFVSMFRRRFGILPTDTVAEAVARMGMKDEHWDPDEDPVHEMLVQFLVDPTASPPPEISAEDIKRAVFDVVEHSLRELSSQQPVVVIVEDLHHVDEVSRELLEHLVRELEGQPALFVVTHRPADQPPWQPRAPIVPIVLRRLADDDIVTVMRGVAEASLPSDLERRLMRRAAGSPFFAEELVRALLESGALQVDGGTASLAAPLESLPIPDTVQEVIAARLDRLPPAVKRVAQVAAVLGREFGAKQLAQVLDGENIDVDGALAILECRGLVHRKGVLALDVMRFGESLTQEIAYESLLLKQRRLLHERVATILEGGSPETAQSGLLAYHYSRSDNRPKAVLTLLQAAAAAERVPAYHVAVKFYREARTLAEAELAVQPSTEMEQALYTALGALCRFLAMFGYGDVAEGEGLAQRARELSDRLGDPDGEVVLRYFEGVIITMRGREHFARGLARAEEAFGLAQRGRSLSTQLSVARGLCFTYIVDGRVDLAGRTIDWILQEVMQRDPADHPSDFQMAGRWLKSVVQYVGDELDASVATARKAYDDAVRFENRTVQCVAASTLAQVMLLRGQLAEAQRWADTGLAMGERIGNVAAFTAAASVAVVARMQQGLPVDALPYLDQIEQGLMATGPAQINFRFVADAFLRGSDDLARAERVMRRIHDFAGGRLREAIASVCLAEVLGRRLGFAAPEVERLYKEAAARAEAVGARSVVAEASLGLALGQLERGALATARRHARHAEAIVGALDVGYLVPRLARVRDAVAIAQPSA